MECVCVYMRERERGALHYVLYTFTCMSAANSKKNLILTAVNIEVINDL